MAPLRHVLIFMFAANISLAATAVAQDENRVAVGVGYTGRVASSSSTRASRGVGVAWRLGHGGTGWGLATGLGWYAADVNQSIGGLTTEIGELHVRPFM